MTSTPWKDLFFERLYARNIQPEIHTSTQWPSHTCSWPQTDEALNSDGATSICWCLNVVDHKTLSKKERRDFPPLTTFERRNYDFQRAVISCSCFSVYLPPSISLSLFLSNIATQSLTVFLCHITHYFLICSFVSTLTSSHIRFIDLNINACEQTSIQRFGVSNVFLNNCFLLSKAAFILSKYSKIVNNYKF